ncbi:MAG: hypothetical protein NUW37_04220 [Planctomycetes bacterium]|nr:hypothetical protein [Planctomycetota bacterium]
MAKQRGLSDDFLIDLKNGLLSPLLKRVKEDQTLCLEIRYKYINIYYRGGNLIKILPDKKDKKCYIAEFDVNYFEKRKPIPLPIARIGSAVDLQKLIISFPTLKEAMDLYMSRHKKEEREFQQLVVRDNNIGMISRATDFYICDIEYQDNGSRFDMVAVHWSSTPKERRIQTNRRLAFIEVKCGDGALEGVAGIEKHIKDINSFIKNPGKLKSLKKEMMTVFNQKKSLGLIECQRDLDSFCDDPKPLLILLLVNHDPDKTTLGKLLAKLPASPQAEIVLATSSMMGYGLFDNAMVPLSDVRNRIGHLIKGLH